MNPPTPTPQQGTEPTIAQAPAEAPAPEVKDVAASPAPEPSSDTPAPAGSVPAATSSADQPAATPVVPETAAQQQAEHKPSKAGTIVAVALALFVVLAAVAYYAYTKSN